MKRLGKWIVGLPIALIVIAGVGTWSYLEYAARPTAQSRFFDVPLTANRADVKFAKGEPSDIPADDKDVWVYKFDKDQSAYAVRFVGDHIRYVQYFATKAATIHPWLQGFSIGPTLDEIVATLGPPSNIATSASELEKILSFDKYNTFYRFEKARVVTFGIYDPKTGAIVPANSPLVRRAAVRAWGRRAGTVRVGRARSDRRFTELLRLLPRISPCYR